MELHPQARSTEAPLLIHEDTVLECDTTRVTGIFLMAREKERGHIPYRRMKMREDLIASLRKMIVNDLFVEIAENDIGLDDGLRTVIGLDSVGFVDLRVLCEQEFNIVINDDDYTPENFTSIRLLASLIDRLQAERDAAAGVAR
jgi:acyl carrier protein